MDSCHVTFTSSSDQKIILDFVFDKEQDFLDYKARFEPQVDGKTQLGLAGQLCEIFIRALTTKDGTKD